MNTLFRLSKRPLAQAAWRPLCRWSSSSVPNYFALFPKTFPAGGPPADSFVVSPKNLRREFRQLQSEHHPDIVMSQNAANDPTGTSSSLINRAYTTIGNPYTRAAHVIQLHHPEHIDITKDDVSKALILKYQSKSEKLSLQYKALLMTVLDAHESLEMATQEAELDGLAEENDKRIHDTELLLDEILSASPIKWDDFIIEAIRIKYWVNIANGIKEWEPGKPVLLTH